MSSLDDAMEFERRAEQAALNGRGDAAQVLRLAAADMRAFAAREIAEHPLTSIFGGDVMPPCQHRSAAGRRA